MIREAYVMLAQEPWCYTPEQIGKLTDWQIENLYAKPAAERAEEMQRDMPTNPQSAPVPKSALRENDLDKYPPGSKEHRHAVISAFVNGPFAMSYEKAVKFYEHQLSQFKARGGQ